MKRVRVVNTTGVGFKTKVYIDDMDVSEYFNRVTVTTGIKESVVVTLEAPAAEVEFDGVRRLVFPNDEVREMLLKYGWTPPEE